MTNHHSVSFPWRTLFGAALVASTISMAPPVQAQSSPYPGRDAVYEDPACHSTRMPAPFNLLPATIEGSLDVVGVEEYLSVDEALDAYWDTDMQVVGFPLLGNALTCDHPDGGYTSSPIANIQELFPNASADWSDEQFWSLWPGLESVEFDWERFGFFNWFSRSRTTYTFDNGLEVRRLDTALNGTTYADVGPATASEWVTMYWDGFETVAAENVVETVEELEAAFAEDPNSPARIPDRACRVRARVLKSGGTFYNANAYVSGYLQSQTEGFCVLNTAPLEDGAGNWQGIYLRATTPFSYWAWQ